MKSDYYYLLLAIYFLYLHIPIKIACVKNTEKNESLDETINTIEIFIKLNKLKVQCPKFYGLYEDKGSIWLVISNNNRTSRITLSEYLEKNQNITYVDKLNLMISIANVISKMSKEIDNYPDLINTIFTLLVIDPNMITLNTEGRNPFFC